MPICAESPTIEELGNLDDGRAVMIVSIEKGTGGNKDSIKVHRKTLEKILRQGDKDINVAVLSVAGEARVGKSFYIDRFRLSLLNLQGQQIQDGVPSQPSIKQHSGFKSSGDVKPCTSGIWAWSNIVKITRPNEKPFGLLIIDTQGTFGDGSSTTESIAIFALSNIVSSYQVYNVKESINEKDWECLQIFTEYSRLGLNSQDNVIIKPFQNLMFLVRNWKFTRNHDFGLDGGNSYIKAQLLRQEAQSEEAQNARQSISSSFREVSGFLLPHPDQRIDEGNFEQGQEQSTEREKKFLELLETSYKHILNELQVKAINPDQPLGAEAIYQLFIEFEKVYNEGELPNVSAFSALVEVGNQWAIAKALKDYIMKITSIRDTMNRNTIALFDQLNVKHEELQGEVISSLESQRRLGFSDSNKKCLAKLQADIQTCYNEILNQLKIETHLHNQEALKVSTELYKDKMSRKIASRTLILSEEKIKEYHEEITKTAKNHLAEKLEGVALKSCIPLTDPETTFEATLETNIQDYYNVLFNQFRRQKENNRKALKDSEKLYKKEMDVYINPDTPYISDKKLKKLHEKSIRNARSLLAEKLDGFTPECIDLSSVVTFETNLKNKTEILHKGFQIENLRKTKQSTLVKLRDNAKLILAFFALLFMFLFTNPTAAAILVSIFFTFKNWIQWR